MSDEVLDVVGAARLLGFSEATIRAHARQGYIPARKVKKEWRFSRDRLLAWVSEDDSEPITPLQSEHLAAGLKAFENGNFAVPRHSGTPHDVLEVVHTEEPVSAS